MIAAKIRRSKIFVRPVAIAKRSERVVYSFLLNVGNAAHRSYFTPMLWQKIHDNK
ncbi:hypothetical protein [Pseudanabaena sp. 'Roaring Creek']|uniref:hypothetical protein n=1 Tax=Pseudanabaena sp. 'Roaring Creek' TaxID=1681830 RepID=UPI000AB16FB0|nr:hypothetical protein [Pseudanabaena sp. 'Roaring Creek']